MNLKMKYLLPFVLVIIVAYYLKKFGFAFGTQKRIRLPLDEWWGDGPRPQDWAAYVANTSAITTNRLVFPDDSIEDLRVLLNRTLRLTPPLEDAADFKYGFNTDALRKIVEYWRDDYLPRWRAREVFLWQFNHFTTEIQGLRMHFLHLMVYDENKVGKHHYPVLLLHGWPSSIREFYPFIHKLHQTHLSKENKYIFNVIVPSLPGYAWSQGTSKPGLGPAQIAVIMRNLMARLGYNKYFIHGSDFGSLVGSHLATLFPENVLGYHSTQCAAMTLTSVFKGLLSAIPLNPLGSHPFEKYLFPQKEVVNNLLLESGHFHLQATKPDTIGHALTDNPVGLAAYILEKWSTWTNADNINRPDGGLQKYYKLDALLDNVMIYYMTNSIATSQRLFAEAYGRKNAALGLEFEPTTVPTGCARFRHQLVHFSDYQLSDKYPNLVHSKFYSEGGHFVALELPKVLHYDFIEFVKKVQKFSKLV